MTTQPLTGLVLTLLLFLCPGPPARAGEFDRLEGEALAKLAAGASAKRHERLDFTEVGSLPAVLPETRSAFLLVKTGQGNYARVLVSAGLQKPPEAEAGAMAKGDAGKMAKGQRPGQGEPIPVLILERFETFEPGKSGSRVARGAGLILYEGFQVDLDTGQVVPPGQGGDLEFRQGKDEAALPSLRPLGKSALFSLTKPIDAGPAAAGPSAGKAVLPGDFAGRFRLQADGRWAGLLELQVAADRGLTGRFRSEANGTSYPVTGQVLADSPQKAQFTIKFPRVEQEYDAFLWTEGKNVLAGSFTMQDRTFGFFAVREGTRPPAPE